MSEELKPCPFCGGKPTLPDGDGTQYQIECDDCGQAMASVQICDLMTPDERHADSFTGYRYAEKFIDRAKHAAIRNWNTRAELSDLKMAENERLKNQAARFAAALWDYHKTCPECGNIGSHLPGCSGVYVREFSSAADYMKAFDAMIAAQTEKGGGEHGKPHS